MKKAISANLYWKCLILCSKIVLILLHNTSATVLLPWQHTRLQTFPILKAFLATFGIPFWYLPMVPCMLDPASIWIYCCKVGGEWKRVSGHGNRTFIAIGVSPLELLPYQVSITSVIEIGQDSSIDILCIRFAYLTHFSNTNNQTGLLFFQEIL